MGVMVASNSVHVAIYMVHFFSAACVPSASLLRARFGIFSFAENENPHLPWVSQVGVCRLTWGLHIWHAATYPLGEHSPPSHTSTYSTGAARQY